MADMKNKYTKEVFLMHHGILGMKWGVRRFQPYPSGYHGDGKFIGDISKPKNLVGRNDFKTMKKYPMVIVGEIHNRDMIKYYDKLLAEKKPEYFICEFADTDRCYTRKQLKDRMDHATNGATGGVGADYQYNYWAYELAYKHGCKLIGCNTGDYKNTGRMHDEDAAREKYMLDTLKEFEGKNAVVQLGDHHLRSIPIDKGFLDYTNDTKDDRGIVTDLTVDNASPIWEHFANRKDTCITRVDDEYKTELAYAKQAAKRKSDTPLTRDEKLTIKNLKRAETANVDKFGQDRDHNALYIAGYSGSGKSTTASGLARKNDKVIRLDFYSEPIRKDTKPLMDKEFNAFLEKKGIDYKKVANAGKPGNDFWNTGRYWSEVDKIRDAIEEYSKEQYDKGNRVIVEGVQIQGDWLAGEKSYYKGKPTIVLRTPAAVSIQRAYMRDEITGFNAIKKAKESVQYYKRVNKKLDDLAKETEAIKNGKDFVDLIYKKGGV